MTFRVMLQVFAVIMTIGMHVGAAAAAPSGPEKTITTVTIDAVAKIMQNAGYRAEILDGKNRPHLRTGLGGYTVLVFFYDCKDKNCGALQFYVGFKKAPKFNLTNINRWNAEMRYGKAYIDKDEDLAIEYDIALDGGVTQDFIKQQIYLFERVLSNFDRFDFK